MCQNDARGKCLHSGGDAMATKTNSAKLPVQIGDELPANVLPLPFQAWPDAGFQWKTCLKSGALSGAIGGCVGLLANVIGSAALPSISGQEQYPLRLIQVFLTFPLGEAALGLNGGWLVALGAVLFIVTGMLFGMLLELIVSYLLPRARLPVRIICFSVLAMMIWIAAFYGVLSWLQPLLFGGNWIVELVPWWVAAATHLIFGITIAVVPRS
jgi:hypothetical protein